jgi:uncharacterized membrane protein YfcA
VVEILLVGLVALLASLLTFYSGFGLGTLLTPVFLLFLPIDLAILSTAIVHLLNNVFKAGLMHRFLSRRVLLWFGIPAFLAAFGGAAVLGELSGLDVVRNTDFMGYSLEVNPLKQIIGSLILLFALWELLPQFSIRAKSGGTLAVGGVLSGFLGGLSGHQGALRSAFLIKLGLSKEQFIATGIFIAILVDMGRIPTYFAYEMDKIGLNIALISTALLSAFAGALLGRKFLTKMKLIWIQLLVGGFMGVIGILLILGFL